MGADADSVQRVLRALASDGVFEEVEPGVFRNTPASELLRTDGDQAWHEFALQFGGDWYDVVRALPGGGRDGRADVPARLRRRFRDLDARASRPARRLQPLDGRRRVGAHRAGSQPRLGRRDRRRRRRRQRRDAVRAASAAIPDCVGSCSTFPRWSPEWSPPPGSRSSPGASSTACPRATPTSSRRILHGLDDEQAAAVLANIRAAARSGARVLLIEAVIPRGNAPSGSKWLDLLMLVLSGGRERTEEEWRGLLDAHRASRWPRSRTV